MHETQPKVRVIASTRVHWGEVEDYLREIDGTPWIERMQSQGMMTYHSSALAEFAGRLCYRSWAPGLNANVTKVREDSGAYHDNTLSSGHGAIYEHGSYTFLFQDVSRVFTHELVRHRAGVAISQESLRYVRLTDLGFRFPDAVTMHEAWTEVHRAPNGELTEIPLASYARDLVRSMERFQAIAAERFGLDDDGVPFHVKKEVTSALRRLAPLGLSTNILWTANLRTLRHVIALRTAPSAEEEIRTVFRRVAAAMQAREPLAFIDMEQDEDTGAFVFAHGKV